MLRETGQDLCSLHFIKNVKPVSVNITEQKCLMSHAAKIFMSIVFNRRKGRCEEYLGRSQYGFRKGAGTREAMFGFTITVEIYLEVQKELYACFVDCHKLFGPVKHDKLIEVLKVVGLDKKDIVRNLYWSHKGCVHTEGGNTGYVEIKRKVRQGFTLSPLLFDVYAERIKRKSYKNIPKGSSSTAYFYIYKKKSIQQNNLLALDNELI